MLDMGFEPQIREVMQSLRPEHQTMLFSATMPEEIEAMVDDYLKNPVRVKVGNIRPTANVSQHLDKTTDASKVRSARSPYVPSFV
jgi:ATP-dependent RNA helicase DDX5/DBP2